MTKLWWSELDVELHEIALDLLGARSRARRAVEQGLAVLAVRPDLRRHERDPAQHRRRAPPRAARADEVRAGPTTRRRSATRSATLPCRRGAAGTRSDLDAMGVPWCSSPRPTAARPRRAPSCRSSRSRPVALPHPLVETALSARRSASGRMVTARGGRPCRRGRRRRRRRRLVGDDPVRRPSTEPARGRPRSARRSAATIRPHGLAFDRACSAPRACSSASAGRCSTSPSPTSSTATSSACPSAASRP